METVYPDSPEKSRKKRENSPSGTTRKKSKSTKSKHSESAKKTAQKREERRRNAIKTIPIHKLAIHLKLQKDNKTICPSCQTENTLEFSPEQNEFHCKSCKQKGNSIKLVKLSQGLTDWKAIAYLEELAKTSGETPAEKPAPQPEKPNSPASKPGRIPEKELELIKHDIDLVALARAEGVELKKQGKDLVGLCPFHSDEKPSLVVSPNNLWHCFGCNRGGSIIDWVMESKKVSFRHAVELLREQHPRLCVSPRPPQGVRTTEITPLTSPVDISVDDQALLKQTISYYHQSLKRTPAALAYLEKRGLKDPKMLEYFQIGFADRSLGLRLPRKKIKDGKETRERLTSLGIFRQSGHEHFTGSIVIPIIEENGNITEVYGRKINDNLRTGTAYHLYLPGPHKGIFNPGCLRAEEVIVCEALIDALSFWVHGFRNVTASYGTGGFTSEHLNAFTSRQIKKVYIAYDADKSGNEAALKLANCLGQTGIECYRVVFPSGKDVNQIICEAESPKDQLNQLLKQAVHLNPPIFPLAAKKDAAKEKKQVIPSATSSRASIPLAAPKENAAKEKNFIPDKYRLSPRINGEDIEFIIENRHYRIRGLSKNLSFDSMRVNIRVLQEDRFHVDTLELYNARQRGFFIRTAAGELGVNPEIVKYDIGRILLALEELQTQQIREAMNPKKKEVILTDREIQEALLYLKSPKLLDRICNDYEQCGLVGERTNILVIYLTITSRKLTDPLAVIIQALSAAGKTALMNAGLAFAPEEDLVKYTAMSGQSLFYMGETNLMHKILAIVEEEGAEKASYSLKIFQSEKSLCMASTGKDPKSGKFVTHEYKVKGPSPILLTTTSAEIDEEFLTRCLLLTANEKREQTKRIHDLQREKETLAGMLSERKRDHLIKLHQNIQRLLKPIMVANPYAKYLTFLDSRLRTRRDHLKYLTIIKSIALLHQYQRPIKKVKQGQETIPYIEVTLDDIAAANQIVSEIMGTTLDELAPQTRKFLELISQMIQELCEQKDVDQENSLFTRRQARDYTGWSNTQVKLHLDRLVDLEYVLIRHGKNGQRYIYELFYRGEGKKDRSFLMGLMDVNQLRRSMEECGDE